VSEVFKRGGLNKLWKEQGVRQGQFE